MNGWFAMSRSMFEHPIFKGRPDRVAAWAWIIATAAWRPVKMDASGKIVTVERGQLLTSYRQMSEATGVGIQALRTLIDRLRTSHAINTDVTQGRLLITLCNYEKYQAPPSEGNTGGNTAATQEQHTKEQDNNIPVGKDADASSEKPIEIDVYRRAVWSSGPPFLEGKGVKEPRAVIGMWLKDHKPKDVLDAVSAAQRSGTEDPIPYITKALSQPISSRLNYGPPKKKTHVQWMMEKGRMAT